MDSIIVRAVYPEEYKLLAKLGRETFYETWKDYNTEADMQLYLKEAFSEEKIKIDLLNDGINTFLFALENNIPVAYAKLRNDRTYSEFEGTKTLEMERIYVRKEYQGKSPGRLLMDESIKIAKNNHCEWIWLGVNIDNHRAIAFYKRYGFEIFGTKMFKLGDAEDQDYLMKRKL